MKLLPEGTRGRAIEDAALELPCPRCWAGVKQACIAWPRDAAAPYRPAAAMHAARWRLGRATVEARELAASGGAS